MNAHAATAQNRLDPQVGRSTGPNKEEALQMFDAQYLKGSTKVFSPWMPRGGDNMLVTLDIIKIEGTTPKMAIKVFTKKSDDGGDGEDADSANSYEINTGDVGRATKEWSKSASSTIALLDLVRYEIEAESSVTWVLFRMLPPVWFDEVETT